MSLASICKSVSVLVGVAPFSAWATNDDPAAVELVAWVNEAQRRVVDECDWPNLEGSIHKTVTDAPVQIIDPATIGFAGVQIARFLPDTAWLDERPVEGPLSASEWERRVQTFDLGAGNRPGEVEYWPGYTIRNGTIELVSCPIGKQFSIGTVAAVPDLVNDGDVSVLSAGIGALFPGVSAAPAPQFQPGVFERLIALCTIMLYRDAKGLPSGSAATQYLSALGHAIAAAKPIGGLSLARKGGGRRGGFPVVGEVGTFILDGGSVML